MNKKNESVFRRSFIQDLVYCDIEIETILNDHSHLIFYTFQNLYVNTSWRSDLANVLKAWDGSLSHRPVRNSYCKP